ncbi:protein rep [Govanella unica]
MCPVCAAKITEGRREDIQSVLDAHHAAGGVVYMMTLTIPHHAMQTCAELRKVVADGWRSIKAGAPWYKARERYGYMGDVRALEVTHGGNGWHPHLHILVFFRPGATTVQMEALAAWFFDRWKRGIDRKGYGHCSIDAFTFERVREGSGAADYVNKWGAAAELAKSNTKLGRNGGRSPWQILADCSRSENRRERALFREYATAFKGARQLTWAGDIRAAYLAEEETSDEALAAEEAKPETHMATVDSALWREIYRHGMTAHVLIAADAEGVPGVLGLLEQKGIPVVLSEIPALERGRFVPFLMLPGANGDPPGKCPGSSNRGGFHEP